MEIFIILLLCIHILSRIILYRRTLLYLLGLFGYLEMQLIMATWDNSLPYVSVFSILSWCPSIHRIFKSLSQRFLCAATIGKLELGCIPNPRVLLLIIKADLQVGYCFYHMIHSFAKLYHIIWISFKAIL